MGNREKKRERNGESEAMTLTTKAHLFLSWGKVSGNSYGITDSHMPAKTQAEQHAINFSNLCVFLRKHTHTNAHIHTPLN